MSAGAEDSPRHRCSSNGRRVKVLRTNFWTATGYTRALSAVFETIVLSKVKRPESYLQAENTILMPSRNEESPAEKLASLARSGSAWGPKTRACDWSKVRTGPLSRVWESRVYSSSPKPVLYCTMLTRRVFCAPLNGPTLNGRGYFLMYLSDWKIKMSNLAF